MTSNYDDSAEYISTSSELEEVELDYFELLSTYIDGEATVAERNQVQEWLDNDPEIKNTYLQLLKLQGGIQSLTVPTEETISPETLSERVFERIDRTRNRKRAVVWGSAIAATIVGTVVSLIPNTSSPSFRMAENPAKLDRNKPTMVAVSLNKPAVIIPKAAVSTVQEHNRI